jgi:hypothetical protein
MRPGVQLVRPTASGLTQRAGGQEQPGWLEPTSSEAEPPHLADARSTRAISLCSIDAVKPSSHSMMTAFHVVPITVPRSVVVAAQQTRSPTFSCLDCSPVICWF